MNKHFKIGIFSWFGFVMPLSQRLKLIKEAGFDSTSVWWEDEEETTVLKKEKMPAIVRDAGLILENIHAPYNNSNDFWDENKKVRKKIVQKHVEWLRDCANYGIPLLVMHVVEGERPPEPNEYGVESIAYLTKTAEELGVKIAIENTRRVDSVLLLLSRIESSHLGYCYDSSHARLCKHESEILLKEYGHRLLATHLSDNDGVLDRHWLPGNGLIDWVELGRIFPKKYSGYVTLEVWPNEEERKKGPEEFLKKAFERASWFCNIQNTEQ